MNFTFLKNWCNASYYTLSAYHIPIVKFSRYLVSENIEKLALTPALRMTRYHILSLSAHVDNFLQFIVKETIV